MHLWTAVKILLVASLVYDGHAAETFTVTSTSVPYEFHVVLKMDDFATTLNGEYDYLSPVLKSPSEHGVEWRVNLKSEAGASRRQIYLKLHDLPDHVSNALVSVNCSLTDNVNKWYNDVANKFLTTGESVKFEFYHPSVLNVTYDCHVHGFLRQNDVDVTGQEVNVIASNNKTLSCVEEIRQDTTRAMATFELKRPDVVLKTNRKLIKGHKSVLEKRLKNYDLLPEVPLSSSSQFDFNNEMNSMELAGFASFLYYGKMTFPKKACVKLYVMAKKYGSDCMEMFCEEKLMAQVDRKTAPKILKYGNLHKSDKLIEKATNCVTNKDSPDCTPIKTYSWW